MYVMFPMKYATNDSIESLKQYILRMYHRIFMNSPTI
jgi:hypothetical protein